MAFSPSPRTPQSPTRDEVVLRLGGCLLLACLFAGLIVLWSNVEQTASLPKQSSSWRLSSTP